MLYLLHRNGLFPADTEKLIAHARLSSRDGGIIDNLAHLGARVQKPLKDNKSAPPSIFSKKPIPKESSGEYALSRFSPALKSVLEQHIDGTLDPAVFPFTKPPADGHGEYANMNGIASQASLRSAKPTWAKSRLAAVEPRQRIIVAMAGGATYAESRACYEVSQNSSREVFLVTSHMLTPAMFLRQLGELGVDRRQLDLPIDRPAPKPPRHLFQPDPTPPPPPQQTSLQSKPVPLPPGPPVKDTSVATTAALGAMRITSSEGRTTAPNGGSYPRPQLQPSVASSQPSPPTSKASDKKEKDKAEKKKKHHFFSSKK